MAVADIGDIQVASGVERQGIGVSERAAKWEHATGGDAAGWDNFHPTVARIGDEHIAAAIDGHSLGSVETAADRGLGGGWGKPNSAEDGDEGGDKACCVSHEVMATERHVARGEGFRRLKSYTGQGDVPADSSALLLAMRRSEPAGDRNANQPSAA